MGEWLNEKKLLNVLKSVLKKSSHRLNEVFTYLILRTAQV